MIGRLSGRVGYLADDHVLIDVGGVGYVVHVSDRTRAAMPGPGEAVQLFTDLLVREDLMQLFGFQTLAEKEWHRLLMSVQGIGAKASMAILGALGPDGVGRAIALGDAAAVRQAPGVGPKIATRLVNELKDKAPTIMALGVQSAPMADPGPLATSDIAPASVAPASTAPVASAQSEAMSALSNLGYAPSEAARAVAEAAGQSEGADTATLIRAALKLLAPA
ncbi:Holliday junction ATP-dependent DNA helicase RuvA [Rhodobacteraceae bacterium THAF1]|uniref:Holliday junction branch migration protein RuvA n=1 Tax=Palleronia sp. THAF1 TaxID=2587842 RepID=UPI000F3AFE9F|nr:Holliday junction branch migration protein RuvA [Palleronia sp. THAF1]QFU07380.1 Holliday junction ATP-dependent DNA helicase RuvA [Palleronia sp. THAF1]VDC20708.1 Holliday junction ATP-dependent DNA helicase RuvA [Rhodobacteraceae bacterium THAF1]